MNKFVLSNKRKKIHTAMNIIHNFKHLCNLKIHCSHCGNKSCHKHGFYTRKFFHSRKISSLRIQRIKCCHCNRTFCVLPFGILPYSRFTFFELKRFYAKHSIESAPYRLRKITGRTHLTLAVFIRVSKVLAPFFAFLKTQSREFKGTCKHIQAMAILLSQSLTWFAFTSRYFRFFYPRVFSQNPNPHNLAP
jgi:hypothetical protein